MLSSQVDIILQHNKLLQPYAIVVVGKVKRNEGREVNDCHESAEKVLIRTRCSPLGCCYFCLKGVVNNIPFYSDLGVKP